MLTLQQVHYDRKIWIFNVNVLYNTCTKHNGGQYWQGIVPSRGGFLNIYVILYINIFTINSNTCY